MPAQNLQDLVPKYLPDGLPTDPYSGHPFHYRLSVGEHIDKVGRRPRGTKAILWSTGPWIASITAGQSTAGDLAEDDPLWAQGRFDLIMVVP